VARVANPNGLFRLPNAVKRDPTIDLWLEERARHVKVKPGVDLNAFALAALIRTAYADMKLRLAAASRNHSASRQG
jgi:hypothetical protein